MSEGVTGTKSEVEAVPEKQSGPSEVKPLPEKVRILMHAFTYSGQLSGHLYGWSIGAPWGVQNHPRVESVVGSWSQGYPISRLRNAVVMGACQQGYDFLLMLDSDQAPDLLVGNDPKAKPFLPTAIDFMLAHDGPCFVGAPYCAGPPDQSVVVMREREYAPGMIGGEGKKIDKYTREEAAAMTGVTEVAGLPTGCLMLDLRAFARIAPPWFDYEYVDPPYNTRLASTEDIFLTRNARWLGIPLYCAWDCWAGHADKTFLVGKPKPLPLDEVPQAVWRGFQAGFKPKIVTSYHKE